jgi:26S proteasome regulatory subunit N9
LDVALEQVEWVVMKALSLGLIKGSMDQVEGVVEVTWVMPRVLDASGVQSLSERFGEWSDNVKDTKGYIAEHVPAF